MFSLTDTQVINGLLVQDEEVFSALLDHYSGMMVRLAMRYVGNLALAEEVAQETWIAVLQNLSGFQRRSSFKTWLFSILVNKAKTIARRERFHNQTQSYSEEYQEEGDTPPYSVSPQQFHPPAHPTHAGHWLQWPTHWQDIPEERLLSDEALYYLDQAIQKLPSAQREVLVLRDIEGWSSSEVCELLKISDGNQRVLLHRARSHVRDLFDCYLKDNEV